MTDRVPRSRLWAVGLGAAALAAALIALLLTTVEPLGTAIGTALAWVVLGGGFVGAGLHAWRRRPANRVGPLMIATGCAWLAAGLCAVPRPLTFTVGFLFSALPYALVVHLLIAYPTGRLPSRYARGLMTAAYALVTAGSLAILLVTRHIEGWEDQPRNLLLVADWPDAARILQAAVTLVGVSIVLSAALLLVRRWRCATRVERRGLAPLLFTGAIFLVALAITLGTEQLGDRSLPGDIAAVVATLLFLAVPYAYLAGLLGASASRAAAVGELIERLRDGGGRGSVRDAIAGALGDPELQVVFARADRPGEWVDACGQQVDPPAPAGATAVTPIVRDGAVVAAILHRAALLEERELLASTAAAAALALDNERLQAELRARVAELQASREKILAYGMAERRRLERDLHDGAQQRLVALALQLNLARAKLAGDPVAAGALLDGASEELARALDELRELARGIHPAVLTDHGLAAAVDALADRTPVDVEVRALPDARLPQPVEAAAYFVIAESLTNVAKYAGAEQAIVSVQRVNGHAVVEVADDGVGGADPSRGSGLRGLADRVAAVDGALAIESRPGAGTVVRAMIPCASS